MNLLNLYVPDPDPEDMFSPVYDTGIATTSDEQAKSAYQSGELTEQERNDIEQANYVLWGRQR